MGRKCCVSGCNGNYNKENKEKVFRLPHAVKKKEERDRWRKIIPRDNIPDSADTSICERHWPKNYETIISHGHKRPRDPPSIFKCVNLSQIPTCPPCPRSTQRSLSAYRCFIPDELTLFLEKDKIKSFENLCEKLDKNEIEFDMPIVSYSINNEIMVIQSQCFESGIARFVLKIKRDLTYEGFHCGILCTIKTLSKNRICVLDTCSKLTEAMRYLHCLSVDHKQEILLQQVSCMNSLHVGDKKYPAEVIARAFEYFSISRSLYSRLREDFELPSISMLTQITSKIDSLEDFKYLEHIFANMENEAQRNVILLIDEVYVKPSLTYQGGTVFGKAVNKPEYLANTLVSFMICSLFGGPKYIFKALPVYKLDTDFLFEQASSILEGIKSSGGNTVSIICDNNRVNQSFFKQFDCIEHEPWRTKDNVFLLFDFVHILKSIRNNWITEKTQELKFLDENNEIMVAKWSDIKMLHDLEKEQLVKLSKLTDVAVTPKPIERQKVSTCLKVFCDETLSALESHPGITGNVKGTTLFLSKIIKFWKICNVKGLYADVCFKDPAKGVILSPDDEKLSYLLDIAEMADQMKTSRQGKREKELTKDTAHALSHTCRGMVALARHLLLDSAQKYVILGQFTSDYLEKAFGKVRQGSGGTYFINVQQVLMKVKIKKSKLVLDFGINVDDLNGDSGHSCNLCGYLLDAKAIEIFENLHQLEDALPKEVKMALFYIAGYVVRNEEGTFDDSMFYMSKYGGYTERQNRGGLTFPGDNICQWVFFSYILFNQILNCVCRKSLCNALMLISEFYSLNVDKKHGRIMSNILLKNYCNLYSPVSSKEPKLKILKLSTTN